MHSTPSCSPNVHTYSRYIQLKSESISDEFSMKRGKQHSIPKWTEPLLPLAFLCHRQRLGPYHGLSLSCLFSDIYFFATFLNWFVYFLSSERPSKKALNWHWGNSRPDCKGLSLRTTENTVLLQQGATAVQSSEILVWTQCQMLHLFQSAYKKNAK